MDVFSLSASITLDTDDYKREITEVSKKSNEFGKEVENSAKKTDDLSNKLKTGLATAAKLSAAAIGAVSTAVVGLGKIGLDYNNQMEQYTTNFTTMLGTQEAAIKKVDELKKFAASTPLSMDDLAKGTQTLLSFGVAADKSTSTLRKLGDIALGNADKMQRLSVAFGKANAQGKLTGEVVQQMIDAGWNPLLEISKKTGESMEELQKRMSDGKVSVSELESAMESATSAGGQFAGGMEAASKTTAGLMSTLKDNAAAKLGEVFQGVSDIIKTRLLPAALEFVNSLDVNEIISGVMGVVDVFTALSPVVAAAVSAMIAFKTATTIYSAVTTLSAAIGAVTTAMAAGTSATVAFSAVLGTCPVVLIATGVAALAAGIGALAVAYKPATDETKKFTDALNESRDAHKELLDEIKQEQKANDDTAASLKKLLAVENKSAAQKKIILDYVEDLNEAIPDLWLAYDETTDSINMTTAALDNMLNRAEGQEEYNASVDRLSQLYEEQTEIENKLAEAELALTNARNGAVEEMPAYFDIAVDYNNAIREGGAATNELEANVRRLSDAQAANASEIAALEAETEAYNAKLQESLEPVNAMTATVEGLVSEMQNLQTAYEESYNSAYDSITDQLGLFEELDGSAKTSIDNLINTLSSQVDYMDTYAANIQRAMELGVDQGLVQKLSDGKEESAQILAAIVEGGEEDIDALNAEFARVEEGKKSFANAVAAMETDFDESMTDIVSRLNAAIDEMDVKTDAYEIGWNNLQGLIDGANAQRGNLIAQYTKLGQDALAAYKAAVGQASPSKKFAEAGAYDIAGIIQGVDRNTPDLAYAYKNAGMEALSSFNSVGAAGRLDVGHVSFQESAVGVSTAAMANAAYTAAQSNGSAPITLNLMFPDGTKFASYYFDPMTEYANANGTPIINPKG